MAGSVFRHIRAWYAAQAQPQPDGSFLVRPFWPGAAVFALPDAAARDRFATVRTACHLVQGILLLGAMLLAVRPPLRAELLDEGTYIALPLLLTVMAWLRDRLTLRRAQRVPPERWIGPCIINPHAIYPRWLWWALLPAGLMVTALGVPHLWARFGAPDTLAGLALATWAASALTAVEPRRRG